jgi:predicted RND superfamily exporter protein
MVGVPILFTSLTTIAGFASLITSPMSATRDFGWYTVFGTSANMICCFTVLFIVLSYAGKRTEKAFYLNIKDRNKGEKKDHRLMEKMMEKIAGINKRHYKAVLIISGIITVISVWGIAKLEFNSSYLEEYGDRVKIYHDYKFIDKITGVSDNFEILLNSNKQDGVKTLEFVRALEKIQKFADSKNALVGKTVSVVDIIKDINRSFHGNDIAYYKLPDSDEEVSQYILLYESSGGEELEKLVSADVATARLTIYIKSSDSKTSLVFYNELVQYIDSIIPSGYSYNITGISYLVLKAMKYIEDTQVSSLFTATVIISLLMVIIFRSFKIGIISMLPNLFPIIVTLGIMGWAGIWLDYVRTLISCIAIGIAVDDTIHFIARYHTEFNRESNYEKALYATIRYVGSAVTISSGVLIIGFSVSMTSVLNDSFYFGMLSSICLLIGLIAEHFVTPSLILAFKPFGNEFNTQG